jgi:hypothetical protein
MILLVPVSIMTFPAVNCAEHFLRRFECVEGKTGRRRTEKVSNAKCLQKQWA